MTAWEPCPTAKHRKAQTSCWANDIREPRIDQDQKTPSDQGCAKVGMPSWRCARRRKIWISRLVRKGLGQSVPVAPTMLIFHSSDFSFFSYAISREKQKYQLVFAPAYGMVPGRDVAILNYTTPDEAVLPRSARGRPLLWFDSNWDRNNAPNMTAPRGILSVVLTAMPPVIAKTGRTQPMRGRDGEEREAVEVELLLSEDQLSHKCWSCGRFESDTDILVGRMARWHGEDDESLYCCTQVSVTELSRLGT
jgi:hypothetical protein